MTDYKNTLNLPQTDFAMKADLSKREPKWLQFWETQEIYSCLRDQAKRENRPKFILHDGPPYANGRIHIGHALNKILKDIVLKSKTLSGFDTPYVPGWDCHGLPIELNVEKKLKDTKKTVSPEVFRQLCRDYAQSQMEGQRTAFKRLGVLGDWENPYMTMDFTFEADIIRTLASMIANGHLHRGSKPVHWCTECGSALAEAEVEYQDKISLAIDVRFHAVNPQDFLSRMDKPISEIYTRRISRNWVGVAGANHRGICDIREDGESPVTTTPELERQWVDPLSIVIWTTTPWTLPANQAVALNPNIEYVLVFIENHMGTSEYLIIAASLAQSALSRMGVTNHHILASCLGEALEGLLLRHPFLEKTVPIILGDHVTTDAGTGAVHTAPAHGQDDYVIGNRYGLTIENPVNDKGVFIENTPFFAGEHVYKANEHVVDVLKEKQALLHSEKITHSYPHCWRHKKPLIFRATPQWFISMEQANLRTEALKAIEQVQWSPQWAQARMASMIVQRPDWCISRQRLWGTPIALFVHRDTDALHPNTPHLIEKIAQLVEKQGVEAWYQLNPETLLGEDAKQYRPVTDTLDVWFDAGCSHAAVLSRRAELHSPADLYLEGSDQYRGWFQSSLLTAIAMHKADEGKHAISPSPLVGEGAHRADEGKYEAFSKAPYKQVLSHGYVLDNQGEKMSKSLGNVILPEKICDSLGADVLRLWVASSDFRSEPNISDEILKRTSETYRRIRNTARFLISNLFDFNPDEHLVPFAQLVKLDQWAIHRTKEAQEKIIQDYDQFEFHVVSQSIQRFCTVDMGHFYLDIIKDRQYTTPKNSHARRSAQTAMYHILQALTRWLVPILSFTAEEIFQHFPWQLSAEKTDSVLLTTWYDAWGDVQFSEVDKQFWAMLMQMRESVNMQLEEARNLGDIGSGLAAEVTLTIDPHHSTANPLAPGVLDMQFKAIGDELRFVFITSAVTIQFSPYDPRPNQKHYLWDGCSGYVNIQPSTHEKCERCWHRRADVGEHTTHPTLCLRCIENVDGQGEARIYA